MVPANPKTKRAVAEARSISIPNPGDGAREYTVQSGDTLGHVALTYYGDHLKWRKIYEANKQTMKNPNFLYIGQRIMIPS